MGVAPAMLASVNVKVVPSQIVVAVVLKSAIRACPKEKLVEVRSRKNPNFEIIFFIFNSLSVDKYIKDI
jgi:hypothetical protein